MNKKPSLKLKRNDNGGFVFAFNPEDCEDDIPDGELIYMQVYYSDDAKINVYLNNKLVPGLTMRDGKIVKREDWDETTDT